MNHLWTILCKESSIDIDNKLLSVFDCIEKIDLTLNVDKIADGGKLIAPIDFQIVNSWEIIDLNKDTNLVVKIELEDPNSKILITTENHFEIKKGFSSFRNRMKLQGLPVSISGKYRFNVYQKESNTEKYNKVASLPLIVQINNAN
jgi:hypothetical protein